MAEAHGIRGMLKALLLTLAALVLPLQGCSDILVEGDIVQLRLENDSERRFDRITIHTPDGPRVFVDLAAGEHTAYFYLNKSYRYATTEVISRGDTLVLQAIDFVGEEPLAPGHYTFRYDITGDVEPLALTQELIID